MAELTTMPRLIIDRDELAAFGRVWTANGERLSRTPPYSSTQLGAAFSTAVSRALATMLGGIPIVARSTASATPVQPDSVETGLVQVEGGIRPQNFDVGYRPDGVRFVFDCKTLNDQPSIAKNWQNMVNDLAAEATTVHSRFPGAVVSFIVAMPAPAVHAAQREAIAHTLERISQRTREQSAEHFAEVISLAVWNPADGTIDENFPEPTSVLRLERFSAQVESIYVSRFKQGRSGAMAVQRGAVVSNPHDYEFDVAVSFAGPQRQSAEQLANIVRDAGFNVFYDDYYPDRLWGKELPVFFDEIYRKHSRHCVMFVSQEYVDRMWTNHERRSAQARALEQKGGDYILPIKVEGEDVELPGMPPTIGYLSLKRFPIERIAEILIAKLGGPRVGVASPPMRPQQPERTAQPAPRQARAIPGLTDIDTIILTLLCESYLENGNLTVGGDDVAQQAASRGISAEVFAESIEMLEERKYVTMAKRLGVGALPMTVTLTLLGAEHYVGTFIAGYAELVQTVIREIVHRDNGHANVGNSSLAEAVQQPKGLISHILRLLEGNSMVKLMHLNNDEMLVERVSVGVKRQVLGSG